MKKLLLVRHAKSSWDESGKPDFERPLNQRGLKDAPFMADLIKKKGFDPDLIISSPAKRAMETCQFYARCFGYNSDFIQQEQLIYSQGYREVFKLLTKIDEKINTAFLFGHNPDITYLANALTGNYIDNLPTCGNVGIEFDVRSWKHINEDNGRMLFFEYPKKFKI